jgi:hypothetical protein
MDENNSARVANTINLHSREYFQECVKNLETIVDLKMRLIEEKIKSLESEYKKSENMLADANREFKKELATHLDELNNERNRSDLKEAMFVTHEDLDSKIALELAKLTKALSTEYPSLKGDITDLRNRFWVLALIFLVAVLGAYFELQSVLLRLK